MTAPIERMQKILALARRGEGGEKTTAMSMLTKLLEKYGMTIADLEDEAQPTVRRVFSYTTEADKKLLIQIVASVIEKSTVHYTTFKGKRKAGFMLTALQFAEVDMRYEAFRTVLRKELEKATERVYAAFVQRNDIGVSLSEDDNRASTEMDRAELEAIMALMRTMKPVPIHRQLESAA